MKNSCRAAAKVMQSSFRTAAELLPNCRRTAAELLPNCCRNSCGMAVRPPLDDVRWCGGAVWPPNGAFAASIPPDSPACVSSSVSMRHQPLHWRRRHHQQSYHYRLFLLCCYGYIASGVGLIMHHVAPVCGEGGVSDRGANNQQSRREVTARLKEFCTAKVRRW